MRISVCQVSAVNRLIADVSALLLQRYYEVWQAERECTSYQNQSAQHTRVIEQSQSSILDQEKLAEKLFVTRREQQKVSSAATKHASCEPLYDTTMSSDRLSVLYNIVGTDHPLFNTSKQALTKVPEVH